MNFIKNNKLLIGLLTITLILLITIVIIIFSNISLGSGDEYGNRLDKIEEHPIQEDVITAIKEEIRGFANVEDVIYNLEGRLANFIIKVDATLVEEDARNYAGRIIERLDSNITTYYDIQVLIDSSEESEVYPIIGYKHKTSDRLVWEQ